MLILVPVVEQMKVMNSYLQLGQNETHPRDGHRTVMPLCAREFPNQIEKCPLDISTRSRASQ